MEHQSTSVAATFKYCKKCLNMTPHVSGKCQLCKYKSQLDELRNQAYHLRFLMKRALYQDHFMDADNYEAQLDLVYDQIRTVEGMVFKIEAGHYGNVK